MSLSIHVGEVKSVLLADGWHQVAEHSFTIDAYEYIGILDDPNYLISAGTHGFSFKVLGGVGGQLSGPMEAVLAVRT